MSTVVVLIVCGILAIGFLAERETGLPLRIKAAVLGLGSVPMLAAAVLGVTTH